MGVDSKQKELVVAVAVALCSDMFIPPLVYVHG